MVRLERGRAERSGAERGERRTNGRADAGERKREGECRERV